MSTYKKVTKEYELPSFGKHNVEYNIPQCADMVEAVAFFGGESILLERINTLIERSALQSGNLKYKEAPEGGWTPDKISETDTKATNAVKNYTPDSGGPSVKAKAENLDALVSMATTDLDAFRKLTPDEILAMLQVKK